MLQGGFSCSQFCALVAGVLNCFSVHLIQRDLVFLSVAKTVDCIQLGVWNAVEAVLGVEFSMRTSRLVVLVERGSLS